MITEARIIVFIFQDYEGIMQVSVRIENIICDFCPCWRKCEPLGCFKVFYLCAQQAPAAFGLVSFLMHAGLERNRIRKHLLIFALAAPVLAMITFLGLSQVRHMMLE